MSGDTIIQENNCDNFGIHLIMITTVLSIVIWKLFVFSSFSFQLLSRKNTRYIHSAHSRNLHWTIACSSNYKLNWSILKSRLRWVTLLLPNVIIFEYFPYKSPMLLYYIFQVRKQWRNHSLKTTQRLSFWEFSFPSRCICRNIFNSYGSARKYTFLF